MKKTLHTLLTLITLTLLLHAALPALATDQPQIILLYSEISDQQIYSTYLVECDYAGDITVDVEFYGGGVYATTVQCNYKITTPGTVSIAHIEIIATGEIVGPLVPVGIDEPATTAQRLYLPLVQR